MFRQPQIQGVKKRSDISWYAKCTFVLKGFAKVHFKMKVIWKKKIEDYILNQMRF